ncbi:MAG: ABC transporter ATP-binding protein [Clostridia bacterium]|jgi:branched-chain amino acid transport system ATP-binding protein|nr:ABC transporter ATP-binding protein [Clostridia bacterium]
MTDKKSLLQINSLTKRFGGLTALKNVALSVHEGSFRSIIGPNGAGKTTVFNVISGLYLPEEGEIWFDGQKISGTSPAAIAKLGIARTFQHPRNFHDMTVLDNILISICSKIQYHFLGIGLGIPFLNKIVKDGEEKARELLDFVNLDGKRFSYANTLSYADQRKLELARVLALEPKPKLLLLDEPTSGLNEEETKRFMELVYKLRQDGLTIIMIEHRISLVLDVSDEILVLNFGEVLADDVPKMVRNNQKVIDAYLGPQIA